MPAGTAPGISTWDVVSQPHRPGTADYNGIGLVDDAIQPPNPATMPTAALLNTQSATEISIGKVVPNAIISILGGASPSILFVSAAPSGVTPSTFTVTRNSAGNLSINWPSGTFPAPVSQPVASLNVVLQAGHNYSIGALNVSLGVQVVTVEDAAQTDLNFTVMIF